MNKILSIMRGEKLGRPYIIAEIGVNHEGSVDKAMELIESAKRAGADAAKFQTYKADTIAAVESPAYWDLSEEPTTSQHELFKRHDSFDRADYEKLAAHCKAVGIDFMSTPFDLESLEWLIPLMNCVKIASADITFTPLLKAAAKSGLPVILSTGASNLNEVQNAVSVLQCSGATDISLLHCVLNYPTPPEKAQISYINVLRQHFPDLVIGYSDHVKPDGQLTALLAASFYGAQIIEKHFTFDKNLPGNDHYHSMDETDLKNYVETINRINVLSQVGAEKSIEDEKNARRHARRSIYAARYIPAGSIIKSEDLICKRPVSGIPSEEWDAVIGRKASVSISRHNSLSWESIE